MIHFPIRSGVPREPRHPTRPPLRHSHPVVQAGAGHDDLRQPGRCGHRRPHAGRRTRRRYHRSRHRERLRRRLPPNNFSADFSPAGENDSCLPPRPARPHPDTGNHAPLFGSTGSAPRSTAACAAWVSSPTSTCSTCINRTAPRRRPKPSTPSQLSLPTGRSPRSVSPTTRPGRSASFNRAADRAGAPRPVIAQQLYNLIARPPGRGIPRLRRHHQPGHHGGTTRSVVDCSPGRHTFAQRPTTGRFGDSPLATTYTDRYWDAKLFAAVDQLSGIASMDAGLPLVDLSLRWLISQPDVTRDPHLRLHP